MARSPEELVQREHHYAMVDEVDSVLVDEAKFVVGTIGNIGEISVSSLL
ncbi:hypothetical protein [Imperialibacter sp.]